MEPTTGCAGLNPAQPSEKDPMPTRKSRCRMLDRRANPCPNEALDDDPKAVQICLGHAIAATKLLAEARAARLGLRRPA